jgi:hypothetical protein
MKTLCQILAVEKSEHKGKPKADVTIKSGNDAHVIPMWHNLVNKGFVQSAEKALGKTVLLELQSEVRNGDIQYSFGFEPDFSEVVVSVGNSAPRPVQSASQPAQKAS